MAARRRAAAAAMRRGSSIKIFLPARARSLGAQEERQLWVLLPAPGGSPPTARLPATCQGFGQWPGSASLIGKSGVTMADSRAGPRNNPKAGRGRRGREGCRGARQGAGGRAFAWGLPRQGPPLMVKMRASSGPVAQLVRRQGNSSNNGAFRIARCEVGRDEFRETLEARG